MKLSVKAPLGSILSTGNKQKPVYIPPALTLVSWVTWHWGESFIYFFFNWVLTHGGENIESLVITINDT